jgi:hypothetical protein
VDNWVVTAIAATSHKIASNHAREKSKGYKRSAASIASLTGADSVLGNTNPLNQVYGLVGVGECRDIGDHFQIAETFPGSKQSAICHWRIRHF